ncbi:hypothetical protein QZH41_001826 [Actinostola sp. cb2023]|nr:hypothetical protein QZH41_001826 [Actinostola sp. cb2023]
MTDCSNGQVPVRHFCLPVYRYVTPDWLEKSYEAKKLIDPKLFSLKDLETEKEYKMDLLTSIERAQSRPLLDGIKVYATQNVQPTPSSLKEIVEAAGGQDCRKNDEFSSHFFAGAGAGIWWSFVTMTTVGYGDKSPKSFLARLFSILWMLIGTIILSIFSAQITANLAVFEIEQTFSLQNKIVAVPLGMQNYLEKELNLGASYTEYPSTSIFHAITSGNSSRINNTEYILSHDYERMQTHMLDSNQTYNTAIKMTINHRLSLGVVVTEMRCVRIRVLLYIRMFPGDLVVFLGDFNPISKDEVKLKRRAKYRDKLKPKPTSSDVSQIVQNKVMIILGVSVGTALAMGIVWEVVRRMKEKSSTVSTPLLGTT